MEQSVKSTKSSSEDKKTWFSYPLANMPERAKVLAVCLLLLTSTSAGFVGGWLGAESQANQAANMQTHEVRQVVSSEGELFNQIAKEVGPSVVSVNVVSETRSSFFGRGFQQTSAGTGFIISEDGLILTNRHVVPAEATDVSVTLSDGTELKDVTIVGRTSESDPLDIAFLKINDNQGKELKPAKIGNSSEVEVGDKVVAIGNALGQFQNTVTSGIISGYGRNIEAGGGGTVETLQNLFQTDAAINQGNSGGPLVNMSGEVIGINTAVAGLAENIGFAIPVDDVKGLITSVRKEGQLLRPYLGVRYVSLTDDIAFQYNLSVNRGAYIVPSSNGLSSILPDSPADEAGLEEGDVIIRVNDTEINEDNSLTSVLGRHSVGDQVTLVVVRDGDEQTLRATLKAAPTN